jgi:hypothetical protein
MKKNCWEEKKCGREPNGSKVKEFGVCPATSLKVINGVNGGINGGRACWAIAGTLCGGKIQGSFALKLTNCMNCQFFKDVFIEEDKKGTYVPTGKVLKMLNPDKTNQ